MREFVRKRTSVTGRLAALLLLLFFFAPAYAHAAETVVMKVYLNTADKGDRFFLLTPEGAVLFEPQDLGEMGFKELPKDAEVVVVDGELYVPLGSLSPGISFEIDRKEAALRITAAPGLFEKNLIDLAHERPYGLFRTRDDAAFLNYGVYYNLDDDFDSTSSGLSLEAGVSIGGYLAISSFSYAKSNTDERFVRGTTSLTGDDSKRQRRYVLGDFPAFSGPLGGGGAFGGLSVSRNFSMTPFFVRSRTLNFGGVLDTPSDVEIYADGRLIDARRLPPGEFEFKNLSGITGSGELTVVIKDAFGREETTKWPYYISTALLKRGLHEYSYNIGFEREAAGTESFKYGDAAAVGFHRLGLTDSLTTWLRAEAAAEVVSLGAGAKFVLWRAAGEVDTSAAASRENGRDGYAGSLSYFYASEGFNTGFSVRGFSREYANLSLGAADDKTRFNGSVGLGFSRKTLGSISASLSTTDRWTGTDRKVASLSYSRRLKKNLSLSARASRTEAEPDTVVNEAFVRLNFLLGRGRSGGLTHGVRDGRSTESVSVNKNGPRGVGSNYGLRVDRDEDSRGKRSISGSGSGTYRGPYGEYTASLRRSGNKNRYSLRASGAVAFINRSVYLSRRITGGFALVKVGDIENVSVSLSNQKMGMTNRKGEVLIPGLISYHDSRLSIDEKEIPVNYEIKKLAKYVSPPLRGGGVVSFDVQKIQAFLGRFIVVEGGEKIPAEYWGFGIEPRGEKMEFIVGENAEFYLENLPPGTWPARLFMKDKECRFDMTIPDNDDIMVDMGEVSCEMD